MSRQADLTGCKYGELTVKGFIASRPLASGKMQRYWLCACSCGGTVEAATADLCGGRLWHCQNCTPPLTADYLKNYQYYRERFTAEQRAIYQSVLRGRKGRFIEAEAVDLVMRFGERALV